MGAEAGVPIVGCPEKWCRFKVEARKGTDLYKTLYWTGHGQRDGRLFDQAELRRKVRLAIAEVIRTEFAHATMEDLAGLAELYPDVTLDDLLGKNGRSKAVREMAAQTAQGQRSKPPNSGD